MSGPELVNIYSWFIESGRYKEPGWLSGDIRDIEPPRAITEAVINKRQPLCEATLDMFVSILGSASGDLALVGMATGGVYLGGGILPRIAPGLKRDVFLEAFTAKGRFRKFMEKIAVRVILNDRTALLGAADCAFE